MNKDITINFVRMNGILHLQKKTLGKVSLGVKLKRVVWNVTAVILFRPFYYPGLSQMAHPRVATVRGKGGMGCQCLCFGEDMGSMDAEDGT